jgi:hypothetical protein
MQWTVDRCGLIHYAGGGHLLAPQPPGALTATGYCLGTGTRASSVVSGQAPCVGAPGCLRRAFASCWRCSYQRHAAGHRWRRFHPPGSAAGRPRMEPCFAAIFCGGVCRFRWLMHLPHLAPGWSSMALAIAVLFAQDVAGACQTVAFRLLCASMVLARPRPLCVVG